jgi:hypothetical protein
MVKVEILREECAGISCVIICTIEPAPKLPPQQRIVTRAVPCNCFILLIA